MPPRIVVVGSSNTDLVVRAPDLPAAGQTVLGTSFFRAAGGKGANQAVAAARLGARVTLVARVGLDEFGEASLSNLRREGIDTSFVVVDPDAPSGVALIVVGDEGENAIAVAPGRGHPASSAGNSDTDGGLCGEPGERGGSADHPEPRARCSDRYSGSPRRVRAYA
jgi:ribokinase